MTKDTFRIESRNVCSPSLARVRAIKHAAEEMERLFDAIIPIENDDLVMNARCKALAMTKLEEAVMWATKGLT